MNEEQRKFLKLPFAERENTFFEMFPNGKNLKKILLNIGGERIVWLPNDPHLDLVVKEGRSFSLDKRKKVKGEMNRCHANTARFFLEKNYNIVTGYALSEDRWLQHSWSFDGKRVIETTVPFDAYFGVVLSGIEIAKFVFNQLGNDVMKFSPEQLMKLPLPQDINELMA